MGAKTYFRIDMIPCSLMFDFYKVIVLSAVFIFLEQSVNSIHAIYMDNSIYLCI